MLAGLALAAWAAIGGLWIAMFAWRLAIRSRVAIYDPLRENGRHE
jgi:hypothetical protein